MSLPGVYLDEDAQSEALIQALRARGIKVVTTSEAGMSHRSDDDQLKFAASQNLVLVTQNIGDFACLHRQMVESGFEHAGMILIQQQKWGPGELARRIIRLLATKSVQSMHNRLEFLSNWGSSL